MPMNFATGSDAGSTDLLPNGMVCFAYLNVRGVKTGKTPNEKTGHPSVYLDCELTIAEDQPFQRRKLWTNIMDPFAPNNSAGAKEMGMASIKRILETGRWTPQYGAFDLARFSNGGYALNDYSELNGLRVAIKIGIEKGTSGYADKNKVAEFISPNQNSDSFKAYERLLAKDYGATEPAKPAAQGGFAFGGSVGGSMGAAPAAPLAPVFSAAGGAVAGGFGAAPLAPGFGSTATVQPVQASPSVNLDGGTAAPSPSSPDTPAWLKAANA